jgi:hypothetical protein
VDDDVVSIAQFYRKPRRNVAASPIRRGFAFTHPSRDDRMRLPARLADVSRG